MHCLCIQCIVLMKHRTNVLLLISATQFWRKKVLEVANNHRDVTFAIASEQDFEPDLKDLGLDESGEEVNVGCFDDKNRKYKMEPEDEFSEETLGEFIEDFKAGNLTRAIYVPPQARSGQTSHTTWCPTWLVLGTRFSRNFFSKSLVELSFLVVFTISLVIKLGV